MIVYAETNFILKLALKQEQHASREDILRLCEAEDVALRLPTYSLAEPHEMLMWHQK